jgi:esterase/lipase superfamily enzyme
MVFFRGVQESKRRPLSGRWLGRTLCAALFLLMAPYSPLMAGNVSLKDSIDSKGTAVKDGYKREKCATNYCYQTVCFAGALKPTAPIKVGRKILAQFLSEYQETISYGCSKVSLPRLKRRGAFVFNAPVNKDGFDVQKREYEIVIDQIDVLSKEEFQSVLKTAAASSPSNMTLFVHGYNTTFNQALARAAQLAYDTGTDGPILLFAWPAADDWSHILEAMDNVGEMEPVLVEFLKFLAQQGVIDRINIIAHSLGAKLVLDTLSKSDSWIYKSLGQIILGSPVITTARLKHLASKLGSRVDRITIFCSTDDRPIWAAQQSFSQPLVAACEGLEELSLYSANGDFIDYDSNAEYKQKVPIDVIDITSSYACGMLGIECTHARYASNASILQDIAAILIERRIEPGPGRHPLRRGGPYLLKSITHPNDGLLFRN